MGREIENKVRTELGVPLLAGEDKSNAKAGKGAKADKAEKVEKADKADKAAAE